MPEPPTQPLPLPSPPRRRRWRLWLLLAFGALLALLAAAELTLRFHYGLGTPVLYQTDPEIEYLARPNQDTYRYGNHLVINQWSMRCGLVEPRRTDPRELRVLLLGDSILFGGNRTDQPQTVAALLESMLRAQTGRPVRVLPIACGGWGPANVAAYLKRYGAFDGQYAYWVLNDGDWRVDPPATPAAGLGVDFPTRRPLLALTDFYGHWRWQILPRYLPSWGAPPAPPGTVLQDQFLAAGLALLRQAGVRRITCCYWPNLDTLADPRKQDRPAIERFINTAAAGGAGWEDLWPRVAAMAGYGASLYRDVDHPNLAGNQFLADFFAEHLRRERDEH